MLTVVVKNYPSYNASLIWSGILAYNSVNNKRIIGVLLDY